MFTIDVDIAKALQALDDLDDAVKGKAAGTALRAGAERAAEIAQGYAPVDTGRLRASIKVAEVLPTHAVVHADPGDYPEAYYAEFQEYGTRFQAGTAFMRPTVDVHGDEIAQVVLDEIAKAAGL